MKNKVTEEDFDPQAIQISTLFAVVLASFWVFSRPLKVHVFEVLSTPVLAVSIPGAHQVGETGAGVMLPFPWIGYLEA